MTARRIRRVHRRGGGEHYVDKDADDDGDEGVEGGAEIPRAHDVDAGAAQEEAGGEEREG